MARSLNRDAVITMEVDVVNQRGRVLIDGTSASDWHHLDLDGDLGTADRYLLGLALIKEIAAHVRTRHDREFIITGARPKETT